MEDNMKKVHTVSRQLKRLIASCGLAAAMFAGGFSLEAAHAGAPASNDGIIITPASASPADAVSRPAVPQFKRGKVVPFGMNKPAGSIVVNTRKNLLYYVLGGGRAVQFRVATAKPGFGWSGTHKVSGKVQWPDWRPPAQMRKRRPDLPNFMEGGPNNPLGARALYLGSSIYRIHGTNEPKSIGKAASSGCIRMLNADVEELYRHVKVGATVEVL
jgi:lipoprotein-anchoring transpeptidase ErfK/SrfK